MSWTTRPQSVQETSGSESSLCEDWVLQSKLLPDHAQLTSKGGATAAAEAHSSRLCLGSCFGSCLFRFLDHRSIGLPLVYTNCELPQWKLNVLVQRSQQDISSTKTGMKTWHYISFGQLSTKRTDDQGDVCWSPTSLDVNALSECLTWSHLMIIHSSLHVGPSSSTYLLFS